MAKKYPFCQKPPGPGENEPKEILDFLAKANSLQMKTFPIKG